MQSHEIFSGKRVQELLDPIKRELKGRGFRLTCARIEVAKTLLEAKEESLCAENIFKRIQSRQGPSCDQTSVYRALALFDQLGLLSKVEFYGEAIRYRLDFHHHLFSPEESHEHDQHEHFFKCVSCDRIEPLGSCFLKKQESEMRKAGYQNLTHHLEIKGTCPSCVSS